MEHFQDLGYRPIIAKDGSTSFIQGKLDANDQMVCNILVNRFAQKALTGNSIIILINYVEKVNVVPRKDSP